MNKDGKIGLSQVLVDKDLYKLIYVLYLFFTDVLLY